MRQARLVALASLAYALVLAGPARAQGPGTAIVFVIQDATFVDFVNDPPVQGVYGTGGIAMLRGPDPTDEAVVYLRAAGIDVVDITGTGRASSAVAREIERYDMEVLVAVVGLAPVSGPASEGPDSVLVARGHPSDLSGTLSFDAPVPTLTSDSTHRRGIVIPADLVATIEAFVAQDLVAGDGERIRVADGPPPVDLYEKYLQYRELSAPMQTLVGAWEIVVGAFAFWAVRGERSRVVLRMALAAVLSLLPLFLALLLVGHLPSLTYGTVIPVLALVVAGSGAALLRVVDRSGVGVALAWAGGIGLAGLVVESLLGWTAAFAPMLGGSHLDGARFFGMPNVEIGLALGGATLVAARVRSTMAGAVLIAAAALWFGSPWFGADIGGVVTLAAAGGLWWGIRRGAGLLRTSVAAGACIVVGAALTLFAHRFLTDAPTHITRFAESSGGPVGIVEKATDRLVIGLRLIADQPPALIPVVGTLAALVVVARSPALLRAGFTLEPASYPAALTILLGSVVAYLANDTGAAALGLGFGSAMVCLFAVSLAAAREKMEA